MDQTIHSIQVGCDNCSRGNYTKDCPLDEDGNRKENVCYTAADRSDNWRNQNWKREGWKPREEYLREKEARYKQTAPGFYQKPINQETLPPKKQSIEDILTQFIEASNKNMEKRMIKSEGWSKITRIPTKTNKLQ